MRKHLTIVAIAVWGLGAAAHAGNTGSTGNVRYKWHDAQGLLHFSDSLSAEAMKYGYDLINDRGAVIQHVQRQLNPEERAAANKLADAQAVKDRAAQELANAEAQMLSAYPDEQTYTIFQQQQLDTIDQQIRTTEINLHSQEKTLTDLLGRAADVERAKEVVPKNIVDSIARQRDIVTGQRGALTRLQGERTQTMQQQAKQLDRYRELKAAQLKQEQGDNAH